MSFIGSLITTVRADTTSFNKKMKKSASIAKKFGGALKKIGGAVIKFGAALGAVAIGALVVYTVKAFKAIDVTAKLASELEIATEKLIGYELAAGLSGVSSEMLFKALGKMSKVVGEAKSGITTGTKALEDFGLELKEIEGLNTSEVFELFADKIAAIEDPMVRAAKASLIFGRAGGKLLNFFSLGSAGLAKVRKEVEDLGLSFNAIDAKKVEEANDAMLKIQTIMKGVGNTLAIKIAPMITKAADKTAQWVKDSGGINTVVNKTLNETIDILADIVGMLKLAQANWNNFSGSVRSAASLMAKSLVALQSATGSGGLHNEQLIPLQKALLARAMKKTAEDMKKAGKSATEIALALEKINSMPLSSGSALESFIESADKLAKEDFAVASKALDEFRKKAGARNFKSIAKVVLEDTKELVKVAEEFKKTGKEGVEVWVGGLKTAADKAADIAEANEDAAFWSKELLTINKETFDEMMKMEEADLKALEIADKKVEAARELANIKAAEAAFAETRTPLEKIEAEMKKIQQAFDEGAFAGIEDAFHKKMEELEKAAIELEELTGKIDNEIPAKIKDSMKDSVEEAFDELKPTFEMKMKDKPGGFEEIDLRHIDIAGITRMQTIEKQVLDESKKQTHLLEELVEVTDFQKVAIAL